ncbi:MAG: cytochrome c maturation protein CcmE [Microthrixaceae bacterium]|nr:cytochrome c maturation protein CcmE [Microthrixaceae bacterium]
MDVTTPEHDDAESPDAAPLDLTPREVAPRRSSSRRRWGGLIALIVVVGGLGFVLFEGLNNATVYFYNVDEAVAKRDELGTSRFRIQGNVVPGTVEDSGSTMEFDLKYRDAVLHVAHRGDVPDLFKPSIPVVLEGTFAEDGREYRSDRMLLRHDSSYDEKHQDRKRQAEQDADPAADTP